MRGPEAANDDTHNDTLLIEFREPFDCTPLKQVSIVRCLTGSWPGGTVFRISFNVNAYH